MSDFGSINSLDPANNELTYALDRENVFHSWSVQSSLKPWVFAGGEGAYLWDYTGRKWLDFSSQLINTNVGHQHPKVTEAIQVASSQLTTIAPGHANLYRGLAAKKIKEIAGEAFSKVFFTNGGADAVENAIRMARIYTGRDTVLSTYRSYHGNTGAAIVATGDWRRIPNQYARGHEHFFGPYLYRSPFWSENEEQETDRALEHLEAIINGAGASNVAAILLESVPGTAGILVPPPGYMKGVRALADKYGIVFIADEVMAGFGRTGKWFAHQHFDVTPDLITFAKGVNSGYVPAGGVVISDKIYEFFKDRMFPGGLTYSGHPLAMASIVATIDAMREEGMVENSAKIGEQLKVALNDLKDKHESIGEVRGIGAFWAIEFVADRASKTPLDAATMGKIKNGLYDRGLLPFMADNRVHVAPPLIVTPEQVDTAIGIYDETFTDLGL